MIGFGRRPPILLRRYVSGSAARTGTSPHPFAFARTALRFGLAAVGLRGGDGVLLPEFVCESVTQPLRRLGLRPIYYPVDDQLRPEWPTLEAMRLPCLRALVLVHYFGQPQSTAEAAGFCESRQLLLIEDGAHGFGASQEGVPLGMRGQVGITSPRKSHPVRNGGYLHLADGIPFTPPDLPVEPMAWKTPSPAVRDQPEPDYASQKHSEPEPGDWAMDRETHDYLSTRDLAADRRKRREIYEVWREWTLDRQLAPVFPELEEGASPLVFPAYTPGHDASRRWFTWGRRHGIDVHSWPTLPREQVRSGSAALDRWRRLVCFPIHAEMSAVHLTRHLSATGCE